MHSQPDKFDFKKTAKKLGQYCCVEKSATFFDKMVNKKNFLKINNLPVQGQLFTNLSTLLVFIMNMPVQTEIPMLIYFGKIYKMTLIGTVYILEQ